MFVVAKSFRAGDVLLVRGDTITPDGWRTLARLVSSGYVEKVEAPVASADVPATEDATPISSRRGRSARKDSK